MKTETVLKRGFHILPHMSQVLGRDLDQEKILANAGKTCHAYVMTDEQIADRRYACPYRVLVRSPGSSSLAWTAFYTVAAFQDWRAAYCLGVVGELTPGSSFTVVIPECPSFVPMTEVTWENPYASEVR